MSANTARAAPGPAAHGSAPDSTMQLPRLHRSCACGTHTPGGGTCSECAKKKTPSVQRSALGTNRADNSGAEAAHAAIRAPGQALDPPLRRVMESHFDRDFSGVRVHHDSEAAHAAASIGAAAYTVATTSRSATAATSRRVRPARICLRMNWRTSPNIAHSAHRCCRRTLRSAAPTTPANAKPTASRSACCAANARRSAARRGHRCIG